MLRTKNYIKNIGVITLGIVLLGCAAVSNEMHHSDLQVESRMSDTIFLNPLNRGENTVYVEVRNTATDDIKNLTRQIKADLAANGMKVVRDPKKAHDLLQVNVLQLGAAKSPDEVWKATHNGYDSVVSGALTGLGVGVLSGSAKWGVGVGLGVAAASWLANEMVKDKTYSMITDIQISEKQPNGTWKRHRTRIATVADKVNLKFEEAKPVIITQIAKEISGIFGPNDAN